VYFIVFIDVLIYGYIVYHRQIICVRVREEGLEIKPERHTQDRERARSERGAVCASCYPCCHGQVFINDVESVASRSDRKKGLSCLAHTERGEETGHSCLAVARTGLGYIY